MKSIKWETVLVQGNTNLRRTATPEGWLVFASMGTEHNSFYIPDVKHEWLKETEGEKDVKEKNTNKSRSTSDKNREAGKDSKESNGRNFEKEVFDREKDEISIVDISDETEESVKIKLG